MTSLMCLALAAYFATKTYEGMEHVISVVLNRVEDRRYPDDVCSVVYEKGQFAWTSDGLPDRPHDDYLSQLAWDQANLIASEALAGYGVETTSTHFHTEGMPLSWASSFAFDGCFGGNCFYTNNTPYR